MIKIIRNALVVGACIAFVPPAFAQQPTDAQISAVRSACRGDYSSVCAGVPTGGKAALQCLQQHAASVSAGCHDALAPLASTSPSPAAAATPGNTADPASAATPPAAAAPAVPQLTPREQARLLRTDCASDFQKYCSTVQLGGGRALACLTSHASELSQLCQSALMAAKKP